jgi:hypothetical protein
MTDLTRRTVLAAAPAAVAAGAAVSIEAAAASPLQLLEFPTPESHVCAFIKILASLEDATVFHMYKGTMEALLPGRAPVKLVDSTTVIRRQVEVKPDGHHISIWEATVYHRPGHIEPLESFENPLNGRMVRPFHQREGRGHSLWTNEGSKFRRADGTWVSSNRTGKPYALEWTQAGERIWTSRYNAGVYVKHPLDPENWPLEFAGPDLLYSEKTTSNGLVRELADPSIVNASATYSLNQTMLWWPWLLMGQTPGFLVWNTNGVKLSSADALAVADRKLIEKIHPTIFDSGAPWEGHVNLWTDYPKMREPVPA